MRWAPALLAVLLLVASSRDAGAAEIVLPDGRTVALEVVSVDGSGWICLDRLAKVLGGTAGRDPLSRYPVWTVGKHRVLFSTATAMTSVDGKLLNTGKAAREKDGCIWVPEAFLEVGLPLVLEGPVKVKSGAVPSVAPSPAEPARPVPGPVPAVVPPSVPKEEAGVTLEATVSADRIRVVFCGTGASQAQVRKEGEVLVVSFALGRVAGGDRELGSGIARRLEVASEGRNVRILLGAGFREYATSTQKSPECLTVVLEGSGQVAPSAEATEPAASGVARASARPAKVPGQFVVALDPGHGGSDTGALAAGGVAEKDLALALSKRIAAALEQAGVRTVLTREGDTFVPLPQRTALANYNRADVLLSIHLNASPAASAKGSETFFMSREATDLWSRQLAEKENAAGSGAGGADTLSLVLWNLAQTQSIVESSALAEVIQGRLNGLLGTKERGVRQAPFVVLEGAEMPAVLVEVAFLTNPGEAKQLQDPVFQEQIAAALAASIADFKARNDAPPPPPAP